VVKFQHDYPQVELVKLRLSTGRNFSTGTSPILLLHALIRPTRHSTLPAAARERYVSVSYTA